MPITLQDKLNRAVETQVIPEWLFREFVDYLFQSRREGIEGFHHATTGLAGEAAECLDLTKKCWVYDKPLDGATMDKLYEEAGDTLHYLFMLMLKISERDQCSVCLSDLMLNNIVKLRKRYPNGFTKADAIARADQRPATVRIKDDDHYTHDAGC